MKRYQNREKTFVKTKRKCFKEKEGGYKARENYATMTI